MEEDCLDTALLMGKRKPKTFAQMQKLTGYDDERLKITLEALCQASLVEFHKENLDGKNPNHETRWVLDMFVPGSAEIMVMRPEISPETPQVADFFERMTYLPLAGITHLVPPGGSGIGMHVIPVEEAIPADCKSLDIEHLSHWLKKYDGQIGVGICSCRKQQRIRGEGSGDIEQYWCIGVGDFADYCRETGMGHDITYDEAMEIFKKAEEKGYVHQITNIDGEEKIFGICNCAVGVCNALRTSQLFNTPNMSRSAYVSEVDPEKCVACGKCVEVCPAGAVRLGQKLCTKEGEIVDLALRADIIQKSGSWFSYGEKRLAQGRDKVKQLLVEDKELAAESAKSVFDLSSNLTCTILDIFKFDVTFPGLVELVVFKLQLSFKIYFLSFINRQ